MGTTAQWYNDPQITIMVLNSEPPMPSTCNTLSHCNCIQMNTNKIFSPYLPTCLRVSAGLAELSRAQRYACPPADTRVPHEDAGDGKLTSVSLSEVGDTAVTSVSLSESAKRRQSQSKYFNLTELPRI